MRLNVFEIEGVWRTEAGFQQPNWRRISKYLRQHYPEDQIPELIHTAALQWLDSVKQTLGNEYHVFESSNFLVLTAKLRSAAEHILKQSERCLATVRAELGELACYRSHGKATILLFEDVDAYYRYI